MGLEFQPAVHPVVDDGVDHRIGHGQPVDGQVNGLHVVSGYDLVVVIRVHEEQVVGQPADGEDQNDDNEHSHYLKSRGRVSHQENITTTTTTDSFN